jgi:ABC-2 type transport system permease protein
MSVRLVAGREMREHLLGGGGVTWSYIVVTVLLLALAVGLPVLLAEGGASTTTAIALSASTIAGACLFVAVTLPASAVSDTIAGERERHTLETLLASPASRQALFWGKALAVLAPAVAVAWVALLASAVVLTVLHGVEGAIAGGLLLAAGLPATLWAGALPTGLGLWLSCNARSTRQAQQWLSYSLMPVYVAIGVLPQTLRDASPAGLVVTAVVAGGVLSAITLLSWPMAWRALDRGRLLARSA